MDIYNLNTAQREMVAEALKTLCDTNADFARRWGEMEAEMHRKWCEEINARVASGEGVPSRAEDSIGSWAYTWLQKKGNVRMAELVALYGGLTRDAVLDGIGWYVVSGFIKIEGEGSDEMVRLSDRALTS